MSLTRETFLSFAIKRLEVGINIQKLKADVFFLFFLFFFTPNRIRIVIGVHCLNNHSDHFDYIATMMVNFFPLLVKLIQQIGLRQLFRRTILDVFDKYSRIFRDEAL